MFKDLKIIELASVLAGPSVGQFFAELGAEVIKIENLKTGGDVTRSWKSAGEKTDDRSAYFCSVNWGKKSVAVDLTSQEGKAKVLHLVSDADVVIASYKPGDAEKLGVAYEQLKTKNERLIYGQITGYGSDDPRVGYDAVIQAESGFMFMNGEPGGRSLKMPVAMVDVLAGHQLKEGLLIALLHRERTGLGGFVEVSLIQTALASLANQASNYLVAGKKPAKQGSAHPNIAPYGDVFATADNKELLLAIGNDKQFRDFCELLGDVQLSARASFATNEARVTNRLVLHELLGALIQIKNSAELLPALHAKKIPAGLIQRVEKALELPQARRLILEEEGLRGLRTFVAEFKDIPVFEVRLKAPPKLNDDGIII
jgi:crotonobetainyl-CoA:carnitine CoA-transferase CaiB-like acyl-CoA transferase